MNDKIKYFLDAWEMNGVGKTVARVQDGPGTVVTLTVDDLRSLAASASAEPIYQERATLLSNTWFDVCLVEYQERLDTDGPDWVRIVYPAPRPFEVPDMLARAVANAEHEQSLDAYIEAPDNPAMTDEQYNALRMAICALQIANLREYIPLIESLMNADNSQTVSADTTKPWRAENVGAIHDEMVRSGVIADTATKYEGMFARRASEPEYAYVIDALIAAGHISQSKVDDAFALAKKHVIADTAKPYERHDPDNATAPFLSFIPDAKRDELIGALLASLERNADRETDFYTVRSFIGGLGLLAAQFAPQGVIADRAATKPDDDKAWKLLMLSAASKSGDPKVIELSAQLVGAAPCKLCGFVNSHCRCIASPTIDAAPEKSQADLPCPTCGGEVAKRFNRLKDDNSQAVALSERERFEAWMKNEWGCVVRESTTYRVQFDAWQARAALSAPASMSAENRIINCGECACLPGICDKEQAENRPAQDDVRDAFEEAFQLIFAAYSKPRDKFNTDEEWALFVYRKVISALTPMQKVRAAIASQSAKEPK